MIELFPKVTREEKDQIIKLIYDFDFEALKTLMKKLRSKELELMGVRELRSLAQKLGVKHYNHLTKSVLLSSIVRAQNERHFVDAPKTA
jgi:hypothetical protein